MEIKGKPIKRAFYTALYNAAKLTFARPHGKKQCNVSLSCLCLVKLHLLSLFVLHAMHRQCPKITFKIIACRQRLWRHLVAAFSFLCALVRSTAPRVFSVGMVAPVPAGLGMDKRTDCPPPALPCSGSFTVNSCVPSFPLGLFESEAGQLSFFRFVFSFSELGNSPLLLFKSGDAF